MCFREKKAMFNKLQTLGLRIVPATFHYLVSINAEQSGKLKEASHCSDKIKIGFGAPISQLKCRH